MSFVEQEDIFKIVEPIFYNLFTKFGKDKKINKFPFPRIKYHDALEKYGTDKPDLRNPIEIINVTKIFKSDEVKLKIFKEIIEKKGVVKAIPVKNTLSKPRSFFDNLNNWAISEGANGLAYINFEKKIIKLPEKDQSLNFFLKKQFWNSLRFAILMRKTLYFLYAIKFQKLLNFQEL